MIQISDPECLASETNRDMDALRELSGAILLAAACRNDEESTMHQYGSLLDEIVGAEVPWHGGGKTALSVFESVLMNHRR